MLLIRNLRQSKQDFSDAHEQKFLDACRVYIDGLTRNGNMISAQPLVRDGVMVSGVPGSFSQGSFTDGDEVIVGYYHIRARDLDEAISIAQGNPELAYTTTARVEVRPIKVKENTIG